MHSSYELLKLIIPALNVRALTEDDFWQVVADRDVNVHHLPLEVKGFYHTWRRRITRGKRSGQFKTDHHIHIAERLTGQAWLETAWHELFHYLLHWPVAPHEAYFSGQTTATRCHIRDKQELEANLFAAVALIPAWMLLPDNESELDQFPEGLVRLRLRALEVYGI